MRYDHPIGRFLAIKKGLMKIRKWCGLVMFMLLVLCSSSARATSESEMLARVTNDNWSVRAPWRFLHGIVNLGLGWTELLVEPYKSVRFQGENIAQGVTDGFAEALYYSVAGIWDLATFWVPGQAGANIAVRDCVMKTYDFKTH